MGAPIAIKLRQGNDELLLQDEAGICMLSAEGLEFKAGTITLNFYWASAAEEADDAYDITARFVRNIQAWLQRAELAYELEQGPPVELLIKMGAIRDEATYGRDYIRWQVAGGKIALPQFPNEQGQMLAFAVEIITPNVQGEGKETAALSAGGSDIKTLGAGGQLGHLVALEHGGLEITGGVNILHQRALFSRLAGTLNLWWEPLVAKQAYAANAGSQGLGHCIYDTRQDIDGGAWWSSDAAKSTSWYNECGAFPVVAVIEWTSSTVVIKDGSDQSSDYTFTIGIDNMLYVPATADMRPAAAHMLNRRLYIAVTSDDNNANGGMIEVDFEADRARRVNATATYEYAGTISERNDGKGFATLVSNQALPDNDVYDVHAAYVEGIGQCVAVGTGDGASIWRGLYSWVDINVTQYNDVRHVWLTNAGRLYWNGMEANNENRLYMQAEAAYCVADQTDAYTKAYLATTDPALKGSNTKDIMDIYVVPMQGCYDDWMSCEPGDILLVANQAGLNIIDQKFGDEDNGAVRHVTTSYSTGPQIGNVLGYWICGAENAATLNDRSRQNNDMTVAGFTGVGATQAADWSDTESVRGKALIFGGAADYLTRTALQPGSTYLSFGAFVNPDSIPGGAFDWYIISEGFSAGQKSYYLKMTDGGVFEAGVSIDGAAFETVQSSATAAANKWHSIVVMYSGTSLRITVWDEDGNQDNDVSGVTGGAIAGTTDPLRIGCRADAVADLWDGLITCVFVAKEAYTVGFEDNWIHQSGLTAERQTYTAHILGGASGQCNAVCATEDGGLILVATGDAGANGKITYWKYRHDHQDRAALEIDAGIHKAVAAGSNLMVASTEINRAYMSPLQDVFFFDYSGAASAYDGLADRNTYLRGPYQAYGYLKQSDGKVYFKAGATTELVSGSALATWAQGDKIQLTFRYGNVAGVGIFADGAAIGSSATYSGFNQLFVQPRTGTVYAWWLGMDYEGRHPIGRVYDVQYWPHELTTAEIAGMERGPGEMPFMWCRSKHRHLHQRYDEIGRCDVVFGNVPGDVPAGVRVIWENNKEETLLGLRGYEAGHFICCREAENYPTSIDGDTTVANDSDRSSGQYLTTTASDAVNTQRSAITIARTLIEELRHYGRVRILALCYETGVTPAHKIQFRYGASGAAYAYATPQTTLPACAAWLLIDCGEMVIPAAHIPQAQRDIDTRSIDSQLFQNDSANWTSIGYWLERPAGCANDFRLDCIFLLPADLAIGAHRYASLTSNTIASQLVSMRGSDFGAMRVGDVQNYDRNNAFAWYRRFDPAMWTGDRMLLPVGQLSRLMMLNRAASTATTPYEHTLTAGTSYELAYATVRPYFHWLR